MASRVRVSAHLPGVREVLHSPGVKELLERQAAEACARCNALVGHELRGRAEYRYEVVDRRFTAGGMVYAPGTSDGGNMAAIDNLRHNTLAKGCGI